MSPIPGIVFTPHAPLGDPYDRREEALLIYARERMRAGRVVYVRRTDDGKHKSTVHIEKDGAAYRMVWTRDKEVQKSQEITGDEARWMIRTALRQGMTIPTDPPIGQEFEIELEKRMAGT